MAVGHKDAAEDVTNFFSPQTQFTKRIIVFSSAHYKQGNMHLKSISSLATLFLSSSALTISQLRIKHLPLPSHVVHEFPSSTWVENIAVRSSGELLVSIVTSPDLYYIDPASPSTPALIASFPLSLAAGVIGITEVKPDVFYVLTSNFSLATLSLGLGSSIVHSIDLTAYKASTNTGAIVKNVTAIPDVSFSNGLATLDASKSLVVIADSIGGAAWVLNGKTGAYKVLLNETEMAPAGSGLALGINGVRVLPVSSNKVYIYFDNTSQGLFCRVPLSLATLKKTGPVEILANLTTMGLKTDDFALDPKEDVAYLACQQNQILRIPLGGGPAVNVLGGLNETVVAGPTSVAIARGRDCEGSFYVTTNGGTLEPINGTYTEGGKVVAVKTKR
jgi:hypothetical protein